MTMIVRTMAAMTLLLMIDVGDDGGNNDHDDFCDSDEVGFK